MATQTFVNETFDPQGNLLFSETTVEEIQPETSALDQLISSLSPDQKAALLAVLQN